MGVRRLLSRRITLPGRRRRRPRPESGLPELSASIWHAKDRELAETGLVTVARRLPAVITQATGLAWRASPVDTAATITFNLLAGIFTAFWLLATTGVLNALFSAGPTPDRVRDAPLLICDEPTAALDARAEHQLFERIRTHADGRTVLLITHRLASVRYADRIYVLEHGRVIEEGDHTELMARGGLYADLYSLQAAAYSTADPQGTDLVDGGAW